MRAKIFCSLGLVALFVAGCGSSNDGKSGKVVEPLDPEERHYGGSYSDWAAAWWRWVYETAPTDDCGEPVRDTTGELCDLGQDPGSEVFFLAGTYGSTVTRTECTVPSDKALFFPLITNQADNGGVEEDVALSDDDLQEQLAGAFESMVTSELVLTLDGRDFEDLERFVVEKAPYEYTLPDPPNLYDCFGVEDVTGTYEGFTSGYFIMLPPLDAGEHTLVFGGEAGEGDNAFVTRSKYKPLMVE